MANQFITLKEIARQALPRLQEKLVMPNLVYKDLSPAFASKLGSTIQVRKPVILTANDFDPVAGVTTEGIKEESVDVKLDKIATVDVEVTALEGALNINDWNRQFIEPAVNALAEKINAEGLAMYSGLQNFIGTPGTTPNDLTAFSNISLAMNIAKVPEDGRNVIWDPYADASFKTIPAIVNAEKSGTTEALRRGSIGSIFNLNNYMAQGVKHHKTKITAATALKVTAKVTEGATQLGVTGTTLTGNFVKGDVLTIAGKNYVVTADSGVASTNAITNVQVAPALPALEANAEITFSINGYTANMAFNPMAFAFVTRPLVAPRGVESYVTTYNGLSLRVTRGYDMKYKKETMSMDILYGYNTLYPELGLVYMG